MCQNTALSLSPLGHSDVLPSRLFLPLGIHSSVATGSDGTLSHSIVQASFDGSRVKLASQSGLDILISRLPLTEQSEHRQVDVIFPKDNEEPLKAIVHQGRKPWSSLRDSEDRDSTMIIYRDVRSLAQIGDNKKRQTIGPGPMNEGNSPDVYS